MFEFRRLYCAHTKLHALFPSNGLHLQGVEVTECNAFLPLPSRPMGSTYKVLKSLDVMHSYNESFDTN